MESSPWLYLSQVPAGKRYAQPLAAMPGAREPGKRQLREQLEEARIKLRRHEVEVLEAREKAVADVAELKASVARLEEQQQACLTHHVFHDCLCDVFSAIVRLILSSK